jgi:hypothetical protein
MVWEPNGFSLSREPWKHPRRLGRLPGHTGSRPVLSGSFPTLLESIRRTLEAIQGAREAARGRWIDSGGRWQLFDGSGSRKRRPGSFRHTFPYGWTSRRRGMPPRRLRPPQGSFHVAQDVPTPSCPPLARRPPRNPLQRFGDRRAGRLGSGWSQQRRPKRVRPERLAPRFASRGGFPWLAIFR